MLKLQFKDSRRDAIWLVEERYTIGKSQTSSIVIPDAAHHHALLHIVNDKATISCMSTDAVVLVNGTPIQNSVALNKGDVVGIGSATFYLADPRDSKTTPVVDSKPHWKIVADASWMTQKEFEITKTTTIGRDRSCDICLPIDTLSRQHAQFSIRSGRLFLSDLGSSNGSFVNGERVSETELHNLDKVKLDLVTFKVHGHASDTDTDKTIIRQAPTKKSSQAKPANIDRNKSGKTPQATPAKATHAKVEKIRTQSSEEDQPAKTSKPTATILFTIVVIAGLAYLANSLLS